MSGGALRVIRRHERTGAATQRRVLSAPRSQKLCQNEYFNENWISRGVPTTEVICVNELELSMSTADGFWNDGWLNRLKKSVRKRRLCRSPSLKILPTVRSTFFCGGPIRQFRGALP